MPAIAPPWPVPKLPLTLFEPTGVLLPGVMTPIKSSLTRWWFTGSGPAAGVDDRLAPGDNRDELWADNVGGGAGELERECKGDDPGENDLAKDEGWAGLPCVTEDCSCCKGEEIAGSWLLPCPSIACPPW